MPFLQPRSYHGGQTRNFIMFPGFLKPVLIPISFQSPMLLFSPAKTYDCSSRSNVLFDGKKKRMQFSVKENLYEKVGEPRCILK